MPGCGMHHEARRFVDNDQCIVLIDDAEWDGLAGRFGRGRRRYNDGRDVAGVDRVFGLYYRRAADRNLAALDQCFQATAAKIGDGAGEKRIKPSAGAFRWHRHLEFIQAIIRGFVHVIPI